MADGARTCRRLDRAEAEALGPEGLLFLAARAYDALPAFYDLIPGEPATRLDLIAAQVSAPGTELANTWLIEDAEGPAAAFWLIPSEEVAKAQKASAVAFFRALDAAQRGPFLKASAEFGALSDPAIPENSSYLPRVSVDPARRGEGLGVYAVDRILEAAEGRATSLHVHRGNTPAIGLYRRCGFDFAGEPETYEYQLMVRPA
jgi:ribosomal protein S18 acetylase RimI-like enzyme